MSPKSTSYIKIYIQSFPRIFSFYQGKIFLNAFSTEVHCIELLLPLQHKIFNAKQNKTVHRYTGYVDLPYYLRVEC